MSGFLKRLTEEHQTLRSITVLTCRFRLNNLPISALTVGANSFPAFSGEEGRVNTVSQQCVLNGPIPRGTYYIVDRESGGRLGEMKDKFNKANWWFALFAQDLRIDDRTFCESVMRGQFRLHPSGWTGQSAGCITLPFMHDFLSLRQIILSQDMFDMPCADMKAYGQVIVV